MARRKPNSAKNKKQKLQAHRAVKRDHTQQQSTSGATVLENVGSRYRAAAASTEGSAKKLVSKTIRRPHAAMNETGSRANGKMKLESRFLKLPLDLLNHFRLVSATEPLERPVGEDKAVLQVEELLPVELKDIDQQLSCPKRPKWRYTMTKLEVEKNEEGMFEKWLRTTDELLAHYASIMPAGPLRTSPSFFERNLQVWRQLWRVTEASSILLILIDVRFPLIHYPPALEVYVKTLRPKKKVIFVLTKTDLVPRSLSEAWRTWFQEREGPDGASVVMMEAYREAEKTSLTQGTQARFVPATPTEARHELIEALKKAHASLLQPPAIVADYPERLARWNPRIRKQVDWDSVEDEATVRALDEERRKLKALKEGEARTGIRGGKKSRRAKKIDEYVPRRKKGQVDEEAQDATEEEAPAEEDRAEEEEEHEGDPEAELHDDEDEFPFLTIGLIGQPNVGKSSLLNALLGKKVVRASRTPGKTKTLQTIFWNSTIRLCDCPGLVCPSFAGMERQVLSGILPIQNVEPVLYFIAQRMPLEKAVKLQHPEYNPNAFDDEDQPKWTTDELLATYALSQGFITAKAGRPDLYRAGAFVLRQLHASTIPWGFRPPFREGDIASDGNQEGIWIKGFEPKASSEAELKRQIKPARGGDDSSAEDGTSGSNSGEESDEVDEEEQEDGEYYDASGSQDEEDEKAARAVIGAFGLLEVEDGEDEESDDGDSAFLSEETVLDSAEETDEGSSSA